jgi:DNA ligase-1
MISQVPVAFVAYDILAVNATLVIQSRWRDRRLLLEALPWRDDGAFMAPYSMLSSADAIDAAFEQAQAYGNEGIAAKEPSLPYTPGRHGKT